MAQAISTPYGAFELKQTYQKNMLLGSGFAAFLTIFCIFSVWLYKLITYEELEAKYAELTAPPEVITETKVEQLLFDLINEDRVMHGLTEVEWGKNLFGLAEQNSRRMEELGRYEYSEWAYMQEIFWAVGYSTVEEVANAALTVWRSNQYRYEHGLLSKAIKYCAIGAYKSKNIIYITFMASDFP